MPPADQFLALLRASLADGTFSRLTLGKYRGGDATLKNVFVRAVALRGEPHLSFVFRHQTRDVTKNFRIDEGLGRIGALLGGDFRSGHLFTTAQTVQLEFNKKGEPRLAFARPSAAADGAPAAHDEPKLRLIPPDRPYLHALGVTTATGAVAGAMAAKFKQINRFVELLVHLYTGSALVEKAELTFADMGSGKGYLTFAAYDYFTSVLGKTVTMRGLEVRPELVALCNRVAQDCGFAGLRFEQGAIAGAVLGPLDTLIALHACDTATDDAIFKGIRAGAGLIVAAPCCHQELRPQLVPPPLLAGVLRHGILRERQAEFVTDALRALLLEWAGYTVKVFEFISTEHTAKNLMIAAVKSTAPADRAGLAQKIAALKAFYGIRTQRLETLLQSS